MVGISLGNDKVTVDMTADASISDGDIVHVSSDGGISPASDTEVQAAFGVADENANSGETLEVVIMGKKQITSDGAIGVGDPIVPAATAGRGVSETNAPASHTHTMPTHSHTALQSGGSDTTPGAHQAMTDGAGSGTTIQVGVDTSGQSADTVPTSSDDPGDTNSADASPQNARSVGMAITSTGGAGNAVTIIVGAKSG